MTTQNYINTAKFCCIFLLSQCLSYPLSLFLSPDGITTSTSSEIFFHGQILFYNRHFYPEGTASRGLGTPENHQENHARCVVSRKKVSSFYKIPKGGWGPFKG